MQQLDGKTVVITGAASGIGRSIAQLFAHQGATLVLVDLSEPELVDGASSASYCAAADVTDETAVQSIADEAAKRFGAVDVVVNCAGIADECAFEDLTLSRWQRLIDVNLTGTFLVSHCFAPGMLERGEGRIINVASQLGIKGGSRLAHYVASKAGVIGLTKAMAHELAPKGILVNAIAPGPIDTPLVAGLSEDWKDRKKRELPRGIFGSAEEVAPTALLLASSPGGDNYVGQTLGPNGGDVMP